VSENTRARALADALAGGNLSPAGAIMVNI
jgi:hypothetical protein